MDPQAIVNLALIALQGVLALIAEIKSQGGLSDDQILAAAKTASAGNDTLYASLIAALGLPAAPSA